jgi:hypothetical protein
MPSREELFEFEKERFEMLAIDAANRRGNEPFVIVLLDLLDSNGYQVACGMSSPAETDRHIQTIQDRGEYPSAMLDVSEADANIIFEHSEAWPTFLSTPIPADAIRVAIVGDGGFSFCSHKIPE